MFKRLNLSLWSVVTGGVLIFGLAYGLGGHYKGVIPGITKSAPPEVVDQVGLSQIYDLLAKNFDGSLDKTKLRDGAKAGLAAAAGDPYTVFLNADEAKQLSDDLSGTLTGIGAEITLQNGKLLIVSPIAESPADKAGLKPKDEIISIDGQDVTGLTLDQAVNKIRGPKGTSVKLKIVRGTAAPFEVTITRDVITVASVKWSMKSGDGYIQITRFGTDTADKLTQAIRELKSQGATKFILDLRNDPGGYLDTAVSVASQWLPGDQLVVEERHDGQSTDKLKSQGGGGLVSTPLVVLINGGSASASEIVAGALHDHGAARLVGEKSFGKGSVQKIFELGGGAELKITVAHWFTPNGVNIGKEGIKPDTEVGLSDADVAAGRDPQLDKAIQLLK